LQLLKSLSFAVVGTLAGILVLVNAGFASAVTTRYITVAGSNIQVLAQRTDTNAIVFQGPLLMDAGMAGGYVDFDPAGLPTIFGFGTPAGTIEDFSLNLPTGATAYPITNFGDHDEFQIIGGAISAGAGFTTEFNVNGAIQGGPYTKLVNFDAFDLQSVVPDIIGGSLNFSNPLETFTPTVSFGILAMTMQLDDIVLGTFDGAAFGEPGVTVEITASINWDGESIGPVPEPSTALLMSLGLAALSMRRRTLA
jgi:hypothetical protein